MNEMIERVARAICKAEYGQYADTAYVDENWEWFEDSARAAIEAMREPTPEMAKGGSYTLEPDEGDVEQAVDVWASMIDVALDPVSSSVAP